MYEEELVTLVRSASQLMTEETTTLAITAKGRANFVTQVDVSVQETLRKGLKQLNPDVVLLAEEQDNGVPDVHGQYWILDPIDGTQNFIRHLGMSAISLAYYADGHVQTGVVYNPFTDELFTAVRGRGATLNGSPIHVTKTKTLADSLVAIGTSPYDRQYTAVNFALWQDIFSHSLDIRRSGSACLDLAYVAAGRYDCYFERNLKPWDMAAGVLLVEEAGGVITNYTGQATAILANDDVCAGNVPVQEELRKHIHQYWT